MNDEFPSARFLRPFMIAAGVGFVVSLILHVLAVFGWGLWLGGGVLVLHVGIFVVWFPAVYVASKLAKGFKQWDIWKAALRACPLWLKILPQATLAYGAVNFFIWMHFFRGSVPNGASGAWQLRATSGIWMGFYVSAMAILYSAIHVKQRDARRRCPNGHPIPPLGDFCDQCGERIIEEQA